MKLEVKGLCKSFQGEKVLHNISFTVVSGKAFGLLGRNGAGKTTTIRTIMNIFQEYEGEILLDGKKLDMKKCRVGYLPEERGLYPKKKVAEQLVYFGQLRGMSRIQAQTSTEKWLKRLNMENEGERKLENLSKGGQQKIQLAQALLCDPDMIILDEPFTGMDPVNSQLLQEIIKELVRNDKLVIFSSHQMNYVEELCQEIAILKNGQIVLKGELEDIKAKYGADRIVVSSENLTAEALEKICFEKLQKTASVYDRQGKSVILQLSKGRTKREVLYLLLDNGVEIEQFKTYEPSLADIFVSKAGDQQ